MGSFRTWCIGCSLHLSDAAPNPRSRRTGRWAVGCAPFQGLRYGKSHAENVDTAPLRRAGNSRVFPELQRLLTGSSRFAELGLGVDGRNPPVCDVSSRDIDPD